MKFTSRSRGGGNFAGSSRRRDERGTALHDERLRVVVRHLLDSGASSVLDLGCGSGLLLQLLLEEEQFTRILGMDTSLEALASAAKLRDAPSGNTDRLTLRHGTFTAADGGLTGFDAGVMVETIEHVPPSELSKVERAVFTCMRPRLVLMTTPNRDYNEVYGLGRGELRHHEHRFEWGRSRFESWAKGVGERTGYRVEFDTIGQGDRWIGGPTQMAIFQQVPVSEGGEERQA